MGFHSPLQMKLIIVESPTKARTIKNFLGKGFKVESSFGHVRDLPEEKLGVDVEHDFEPTYVIPPKAKQTIQTLKNEMEKTESVTLATDEDREGESIAWHLAQALGLENPERIVFHEITKPAIEQALKNSRRIDLNLVNAQQARRILDRLVGYKLSPFLWKKVARRLSAGRVQSVAVRLVVDRENEIRAFKSEEYWIVIVALLKNQIEFEATLAQRDGEPIPKLGIKTKDEADKIVRELEGAEYRVGEIEHKEMKRNPLPPFTTSTVQQTASQKLRFPAAFTMQIAQQLYEMGFITYHRTDSLNLSQLALEAAKNFIGANYGSEYWAGYFRTFKTKSKRAQEAHEAIRPTYPNQTPEKLKEKKLNRNQWKLYALIWQRFIASQMAQAIFDATSIDIEAKNPAKTTPSDREASYTFRANGQAIRFDGFLKVYPMKFEETGLPILEKDELLELKELIPSQHFTEPPPRYNEATLIKALELYGIGRPSTYAPILSTIEGRNYVEKDEQRRLHPAEIGEAVNNLLVKHFPDIVDIGFTAKMEEELDEIAQGKKRWVPMIKGFYDPFAQNLEKKYQEVSKQTFAQETTDKTCSECGSPLIIRLGKYGKFYGCSTFPKCKYTDSLEKNTLGIPCPKCSKGEITAKRTKRRKIFYGCNRFPDCDFALWDKPTGEKCEKCGSLLVETKRKQMKCSNPECDLNKVYKKA